jgi:hypothetical protein
MEFIIERILDYEMIHFASDDTFIASKGNKIFYNEKVIEIPENLSFVQRIAMQFRKTRRLLRLDKSIVYPVGKNLVVIRNGRVLHYNNETKGFTEVLRINCRNPMYLGITETDDGTLFLGEYGNPTDQGKRVFQSDDGGRSWNCIYTFHKDEIRHIHCIAWDSYDKKIWVFTGDFNGECKIICTDKSFKNIKCIGDGGQRYRACHVLFSENYVDWIMDSPLETVKHIRYDRKTNEILEGDEFAGPVWFVKRLQDEITVAASIQEIGPSHKDKFLHLYATEDMKKWQELKSFKHDGWPKRYFRFGTICFARGEMKDDSFYIFCEGVKGLDGKAALCRIVD